MRLLLHTCCAPCATHCLRVVRELGHTPILFFSNANIAPDTEYARRLEAVQTLAAVEGVECVVDPTDHAQWLEIVARGAEAEPERGVRCARCFRYAFERTLAALAQTGTEQFCTTLTVSPHKVSSLIFAIGREIGGDRFLPLDFKKQNGFLESLRLTRKYNLYRQDFCGCEFSRKSPTEKQRVIPSDVPAENG